jgi:hypothetical protein
VQTEYTSAPPGTLVEIQLARVSESQDYPLNVHCQFQAVTTKQNEWEILEFSFSQIPKKSITKAHELNQVNILFAPNSKTGDVFYFADLEGPELQSVTSSAGKRALTKGK